ncbi:peptidoglycan DD-metalloendopeptidase family protein [Streptomyces sp. B-S-A8]|uniref:Peptidoglycan DD-metalloendopeptidase family protein n=1 Tax=Streptomyces solicavernae TaxID=3043614 RepID=A0ABT6RYK9_9ACTN|nr:peptidoglycan DD-metalloendopeptidase family protein [Streptomyces sp. B-S-A8]MDI3388751.1 peptidoglycan DD-metalloendopeptidase family protein [Streptomyces sp. B-S-A8]
MATPTSRGATGHEPAYFPDGDQAFGHDDGPWEEWNPTEESVRPVRGRHRVGKQRGGFARSSTVLGVGVIAAVGAGGIATAKDRPPVPISLPDLSGVTDSLPDAESLPGIGSLISDDSGSDDSGDDFSGVTQATAAGGAPVAQLDGEQQAASAGAGEALRSRIMQQAASKQDEAAAAEQAAAADAAAKAAAEEAERQQTEAERQAAEAKRKAEEEAKRKAEAERLAKLARSFVNPLASYTISTTYGQAGSMWASGYHTGLDFAAPTGTPIKSIHSGTVKEAGWSGSYGYRTVIELEDGTELAYNHQSSMSVSVGQKVTTGDVIGRVGSTGNSTGPHLHFEVKTPGGDLMDPAAWLRDKGVSL